MWWRRQRRGLTMRDVASPRAAAPQSGHATDLPETNPGSDRDPAGVTSRASSDDWCRASVEAHERRGARINHREPTGSVKATSLERHQPTRAKVTSGHGSAPRRWRLMSQARMAAAPTSYARHQAGHQAGTSAFSMKCS